MAIEEITDASTTLVTGLATELGKIGLWIQTVGILIILWIVFQIAFIINNRIRRKKLYNIEDHLKRLEKKIDKIQKQTKK